MVTSKMLVEQDPLQTRVAVLEDDRLAELYIERPAARGVAGNVYKGRVSRVLPGMQAAFVDLGLERDAFLYVDDVRGELHDREDVDLADGNGSGPGDGENGGAGAGPPPEPVSISELLRQGQEIVVQAIKDPLPNKGARVSTHVTLPGRYLVYAPTGHHRGVSRRIEDADERQRLRDLAVGLELPGGWIVRTAAEGKGADDLLPDAQFLHALWGRLTARAAATSAPALLHHDLDLAVRVVRDLFGPDVSVLWVEGEEAYERIVEFLDQLRSHDGQPHLLDRVRLFRQEERTLFERFGVEEAIEEALQPKVWLKSGGYLVINPTEALVAIDVNTGRFTGGANLDDTILKTNLEAVKEIVRQIRLRNLGGILVLDLIDMGPVEHREQVFAVLEAELKRDRAKNKVLSISEFGLVELTRKRSRPSLERQLTQTCPYCGARGRVKSTSTVALAVRRQLLRHATSRNLGREVLVRLHPDVARALHGEEREVLADVERQLGLRVVLQADPAMHHERFDVLEV
jgi:ribonuclease G